MLSNLHQPTLRSDLIRFAKKVELLASSEGRRTLRSRLLNKDDASLIRGTMRYVSLIFAVLAGVVGSLVLLGWLINDDELVSLGTNQVPMKANTALSLVLLSFAFILT